MLGSHQQEYHINLVQLQLQLRLVVVFKVVQAIMTATRIPEKKTKMTTSLFKSQGAVLKVKSKATLLRKVFHAMAGFVSILICSHVIFIIDFGCILNLRKKNSS